MVERLQRMDRKLERQIIAREAVNERTIRLPHHGQATEQDVADAVLEGLEYFEGVLGVVSPFAERQRRLQEKSA